MEKLLDYNKVWAILITIGILVLLDYLGLDLPRVIEAVALIVSVERTPNGRVPLRDPKEPATV